MSTFISQEDYKVSIKENRLLQMLEADVSLLDEAESTAIAFVRDALFQKYDVDVIFAATGDTRARQVVRWVKCLSLYYLYERIPDRLIPKRVIADYEEVQDTLFAIADGKRSTNLPTIDADGDGNPNSKFRWGSQAPRSH